MYNIAKKLIDTIGYSAPIKALTVSAPQVYIISRRLLGGEFGFPSNSTSTSLIPSNVFEQATTGALFPGTAASLIGSRLKLGDRLDQGVYRRFGKRVPLKKYLNYAIPAIGGTLLWDGVVGTLGRLAGVEGFERPGLIPLDIVIAATLSTGYAYLADNTRRIKWALAGGAAFLLLLGSAYGYESSKCEPVAQGPYTKGDVAVIISGGDVPKPKDLNHPAFTSTRTRIEKAAGLFEKGLFPYIVLTGTPEDVKLMARHLDERNIPYKLPPRYGTNTTEDLRAGFEQIPEGSQVGVIGGKKQIPRTALISEMYNLDPEKNDGYFGVDGTDMGDWLGGLIHREHVACAATRIGVEKFKGSLPFQ